MASRSQSQTTTDHETIQRWAEERNAKPSCVRGTGDEGDVGMIRLDFPGYSGEESLEEISWDEWFEKFDESGLALLYQDTTARGEKSNFNKLISREAAEGGVPRREQKRAKAEGRAPRQRGRAKATTARKKTATGRGRRATAGESARSTRAKRASSSRSSGSRATGTRRNSSRTTASRSIGTRAKRGAAKSAARKTAQRGRPATTNRRTRATATSRTGRKTAARGTSSRGTRTNARGAKKATAKRSAKVLTMQGRRSGSRVGNNRRGRGRAA